MKRVIGICFSFLLLILGAGAESLNIPEAGTLKMQAGIRSWMPLDEERTEDLDKLLRHFSLNLAWTPGRMDAGIRVDSETLLEMNLHETEEGSELFTNLMPDTVFTGKNSSRLLESLFGTGVDDETLGLLHAASLAENAMGKLGNLFESPELFTEKKEKQNVRGYGQTTRRLTYAGDPEKLVSEIFPDPAALIPSGISGELYGLLTDDGQLHKAGFSGKAGEWKTTASWKHAEDHDLVTLEAERRDQDIRTGYEFEFEIKREPENQTEYALTVKKTAGKEMVSRYITLKTDRGDQTLKGHFTSSTGAKETGIVVQADYDLTKEAETFAGTVEILKTEDKKNPFSVLLHVQLQDAAPEMKDFPSLNLTDPEEMTDAELALLRDKAGEAFSRRCLRLILDLPGEDLAFVTGGLDSAVVSKMLDTLGPVVDAGEDTEPADLDFEDFQLQVPEIEGD